MAGSLAASFAGLTILSITLENRFKSVFDPRTQSWAFLADVFLVGAFGIAAAGWPDSGLNDGWRSQWRFYAVAVVISISVTYAFTKVDHERYAEYRGALNSPTKIWHDYVTVPVFVAVGIVVWLPLMSATSWHRWAILGCIVAWVVAAVLDVTVHKPDVRLQHVVWPLKYPASFDD